MPDRTIRRFLAFSLPAFAALFAIHLQNSLGPLLHGRVPPDLGYSEHSRVLLQVLQLACITWLAVVYAWAIWRWDRARVTGRDVAVVIAVLTLAAWLLVPANSSDVLEYLGFGRLAGVYGLNPYTHTYSELSDWFASYVTWDDPMPYGPPLLPIFTLAGLLSSFHVLAAIYAVKLAWAAVHLLDVWLVYRIACGLGIDGTLAAFAVGCNPLVLIELVGNGHNDGVLIAFGLAAVLAVQQRRGALAMVLACAAAVVKVPGVVWFVPVAALLLRTKQWRALAWGTAGCVAIAGLLALWPGCLDALTVLNSQWHFSEDSLHTILIDRASALWVSLSPAARYDVVFDLDRAIATPVFAALVLWRAWRVRDVAGLLRENGWMLLVLLLGYAVSVDPWYFTWLVPVAVLTDSARLRRTTVVACASVVLLYAFPFALVETGPHHEAWGTIRLAAALGPPLVVVAAYPVVCRLLDRVGRTWLPGPAIAPMRMQ
ncbi:MAG TPA: hypothetical protein VG871_13255 [Vicinamibacterales bacterium]|nr:hypothetical protein [Vicinamibacterales bacterium]